MASPSTPELPLPNADAATGNSVDSLTRSPSVAVVPLVGEKDLSAHDSLKVALARAAIQAPNVIIDLSRCDFIDSSVIGLLLDTQRIVARDGGAFVVALPAEPNAVTRIAELVHLSQRVPTYPSVAAALESLQPEGGPAAPVMRDAAVRT